MSIKTGQIAAGTVASSVLLAILTRRGVKSAAEGAPLPEPDASNIPRQQTIPTERPKPRAAPREVKFIALSRYEIEADVLPVDGVGLRDVASKALAHLRFDDPTLKGYRTVDRPGVGKVTRVKFRANSLINNSIALDREYGIAGVGSVWLVAAKELR